MTQPGQKRTVLLDLAFANAFVSQLVDREVEREGLPITQLGLLILVDELAPVTPTVLENESGLAGATVRDRVRSLQRSGFVERVPNPEDGRSYLLRPSAQGSLLLERSAPAIRRSERLLEGELGTSLAGLGRSIVRLQEAARGLLERDR